MKKYKVNFEIARNAEAKHLLQEGRNIAQIADILGVSRQHIRRIKQEISK